jgi:hypothetical protein
MVLTILRDIEFGVKHIRYMILDSGLRDEVWVTQYAVNILFNI